MSRVEPPDLPADVIARARDGDEAALGALYRRYEPTVRWAVGLRIHRWPELEPVLEDIVQDVWWELLKNGCKRLRYHEPSRGVPLWRFVAVISIRLAWRLGKRRLKHPEIVEVDVLDDDEDLEARLLDADLLDRLCALAKARLDATDLALLEGYFVRGEQLKDVGARLGMNENAAYKRKERLQKKLQTLAQELLGAAHPKGTGELVAIAIAAMVVAGPPEDPVRVLATSLTEVDHA
jgi:RNA polymerase sigma factor (sigma-70 family)